MITFFADDHYAARPGWNICSRLSENIVFRENDWSLLESGGWEPDCELLILHLIGGSCGQPHPGPGAEKSVRRFVERGGNILLLHGSSAAFWQWEWWRRIVGLRWVRPGDPDGTAPSVHPVMPCEIVPAKTRHPLAVGLRPFSLPEDEIYTELEQTAPLSILMTTTISTGTWPQCCECVTEFGGRIVSFIPGHRPEATGHPMLIQNIEFLISRLTARPDRSRRD